MPTSAIITWTNQKLEPAIYPDDVRTLSVKLGASLSLAKGTVLGRKGSDGKYYAYSNAASDGTEVAAGILPYGVQTDSGGNVTLSGTSSQNGGEHGQEQLSIPMYVRGYFKTTELTGLDSAAVADLGRIVAGTLSDGILAVR